MGATNRRLGGCMRRTWHTLVAGLLVLCIPSCEGDPPGDGFLIIFVAADNTGADDVGIVEIAPSNIEVVISDTSDGEQRVHTFPADAPALVLEFVDGLASRSFTLPVPAGFVHQVRLIADSADVVGPPVGNCENAQSGRCNSTDTVIHARIPSGSQTGLKINPLDGTPFPIFQNRATTIDVFFFVQDKLVRNRGNGYKWKPTLDATLVNAPKSGQEGIEPGKVILKFAPDTSQDDRDVVVSSFDSRAVITAALNGDGDLVIVDVPTDRSLGDAFVHYAAQPAVEWLIPRIWASVAQDNPRTGGPDDPDFPSQDYLLQVAADDAWDRQIGRHTTIVAVLDSGIALAHPDLYLNLFLNEAEIPPELRSLLVDTDNDGIISFVDLNAPENADLVADTDGLVGRIDGLDVLVPISFDGATNAGGFANDIDDDGAGGFGVVTDDLVGARFTVVGDETRITNDPQDDHVPQEAQVVVGHGTSVAGLIGAIGNNQTQLAGVNWNVRLLPIKVATALGNAPIDVTVRDALRYARRMGARVANMSLETTVAIPDKVNEGDISNIPGGVSDQTRNYQNGLDLQVESMVLVLGAGNTGSDCDDPYMVCVPHELGLANKIVVGAVNSADERAAISCFGPRTVKLSAPGENIVLLGRDEALYVDEGTSFSTGLVTGAAALLFAQEATATAADVRDALLAGADQVGGLEGSFESGRRLNVAGALDVLDPP